MFGEVHNPVFCGFFEPTRIPRSGAHFSTAPDARQAALRQRPRALPFVWAHNSTGALTAMKAYRLRGVTLHGNRYAYRQAGSGPVVVLIHGITSDSTTWAQVMPGLAERFTVIAPDLLGHGGSAKPTGDYSLGAHASLVRDILQELGHDQATFVGHSLGGGIAMQIAYQFPERCKRLILVDSGGLGREVSLLLRAATLPGAEYVLPILTNGRLLDAGRMGE